MEKRAGAVLKNLFEIFPSKSDREDFCRCEQRIVRVMKREMCREERVVAYIRYYAPFYGRDKKKKLKGCGERSISRKTGLSLWRVRMILRSFTVPGGYVPEAKTYKEMT